MEYQLLGNTTLRVSKLCFGALTIGPLQAHLPMAAGASVIKAALENGINFIDTAKLYRTYPYIREALKNWSQDVVIASKSYDYTADGMKNSVEEARWELDRDVIDIFLLHEQESIHTFRGHAPAYAYLQEAQAKGIIRAIGISTHSAEMVKVAAAIEEIEVIHPLFNRRGIGILDGTTEDMAQAIIAAGEAGKGIYAMKALGGGHLNKTAAEEFAFVLGHNHIHAVAVGMKSTAEVLANCAIFSGEKVDAEVAKAVQAVPRRLHVEAWCSGCGTCTKHCPSAAIKVENGIAVPNPCLCVFCGYCGAHCPEFCIKVI